ncbi:MAG: hypothetical protein ABI823_20990 [Bryobacteraceae bacterium]
METLMLFSMLAFADPSTVAKALAPGDPLPVLSGQFLTGKKAELPAAAGGKVALLAIGFSYDSRFAVEAWSNRFRKDFARSPKATFFEIPMISGMARMAKWFIDSGMRRGTPKELRENVITVYGGVDPWKQRLGFENDKDAHLIVIDANGVVRWVHNERGDLGEAKYAEMKAIVEELLSVTKK